MKGQFEEATILWGNCLEMKDWHPYATFNLLCARWQAGAITDQDLTNALEESDQLNSRHDTTLLKALLWLGLGEKSKGLEILKKVFSQEIEEEKEDSSDFDLSFREKAREVFHDVELA